MKRVLLAIVLLMMAAPGFAQQRPAAPPLPADTLTPQQRALLRLRTMPGVGQPDTITAVEDSISPQGVVVAGADSTAPQTVQPPPSQVERDSVMNLLLSIAGYVGTEYAADSAVYFADSARLELRGVPQVAREGNQLVADSSIIYNQAVAVACGYGSPVLYPADQSEPLASDTVCFDVERQLGRAYGASTRVQQGATWNVRCDAYFVGDRLYCHDAIFTDCDETEPHYHFGAGELKALRGNVMVAKNVTLTFGDVPVFWLPFMIQSLSRGRRSGILMPRFGINDIARQSSNYNRRVEDVGFYLAINEFMDAEVAMDWMSDNWTALRGSFAYSWARQFLNGSITSRRYWMQGGNTNFTLSSQNSWRPDERTSLSLGGNYTTSASFIERNTLDPRELNRSIDSNGSIQRRFDWGSASLGVSRSQYITDNTVRSRMPSLSLNISPVTFFEALPGEERWFSNVTWSGNGNINRQTLSVAPDSRNLGAQSGGTLNANLGSSLTIGRFSIGQGFNLTEQTRDERRFMVDSVEQVLPDFSEQRGDWNTSMSFTQRVIGTSTISPRVSLRSDFIRNDSTGQQLVMGPTRIDFGSSLRLELFGFYPGVGPFQGLRHRVSPSFSYSYSPAVRADSLQTRIFGNLGIAEQNRITLGLTQTIEAKYRDKGDGVRDPAGAEPADTTAVDTAAAEFARTPGQTDTLGGVVLRRREQVRTISLIAISTNALIYDFVRARDGVGLVNTQVQNSIQSDLLRGMQLSITHDLFRTPAGAPTRDREFAPHLRNVNASFSLNSNSWLFRVLGLGRSDTTAVKLAEGALDDTVQAGPAVDRTEAEMGLIGTSRRTAPGEPRGPAGTWNANFNYTLERPRPETGGLSNQSVTGNLYFQPTENWTVQWNTGYSFTQSRFSNHILTLTRRLHDWDASFDFVKAQNGNFSMRFSVHLRANPDIKMDYSQSDIRGLRSPNAF